MSDQYQFQSLTTDNCTTHDDILSLILTQFTLIELLTLRFVSHAWNRAVQYQFRRRTKLTLNITCPHDVPPNRNTILCRPMEMFYLEDIIKGQELIAQPNHPREMIQVIGEVLTVEQYNFPFMSQFLQKYTHLRHLIIYWKGCYACGQMRLQKNALLKLIQHSSNLQRLSFWHSDTRHQPRAHLLNGLCRSLLQEQTSSSLKQLDFNLFDLTNRRLDAAPFLSFLRTLTNFTLGNITVDLGALFVPLPLPTEGYALRQLKLTGSTFAAVDLPLFRRLVRQFPLQNLTTVALFDFSDAKIAIICEEAPNITTLKLVNSRFDLDHDFTNSLAESVHRLSRLTNLILVNYHIMPTPQRFYRLRTITHLTLVHHDLLGEFFYTEFIPPHREFLQLHVPTFCTAIQEQFPSLVSLNLLGKVVQVEETMHHLQVTFPAHIQLRMIFEGNFVIFAPLFILDHRQLFPEIEIDMENEEDDFQGFHAIM